MGPDVDLTRLVLAASADEDDGRAWAECGGMWLTGRSDGPHLPAPSGVVGGLRAAADALASTTAALGTRVEVDGPALVGERAAIAGLRRNGATSCGGASRLLRARDGWIAVSLPRPDDLDLLPAWLGITPGPDPWATIALAVAARRVAEVTTAGAELGLGVAGAGEARPSLQARSLAGPQGATARSDGCRLRVVDLSALWAGPLCGQLLVAAGMEVIKVESTRRPDGARAGPAQFYDLLNGGKRSVAVDLTDRHGRAALRRLLATADVVIEASRPRALEQLGVDVAALAATGRLRVWASITAHGRSAPGRVGFGDDAAAAGGLLGDDAFDGGCPTFLADAIADPASGLVAAACITDRLVAGGRWLVDVPLAGVAAALARGERTAWAGAIGQPTARPAGERATPLGADTAAVLGALDDSS